MTGGRGGERGFALIAVIWFVALVALVAVVVTGWMTRSLSLATRLQDRLAAHGAVVSAENEIVFRMLSGYFSARGIELPQGDDLAAAATPDAVLGYQFAADTADLALDDRPYRLGSTVVRLQDDRGLYPLNHPDRITLGGLLRHYGIENADRDVLLDRLLDYMEKSGLHRLNGANAQDYLDAGQLAPRGTRLLTPWETLRVLSWADYPALWQGADPLPELATIGDNVQLNPNTAPQAILASLPGMDEDSAARVVSYRARFVMQNQVDLAQAAGVALAIDPMSLMFFPADSFDLTIDADGDPRVHRFELHLTPQGTEPYRINFAVALPANKDAEALVAKRAQFPDVPPAPKKQSAIDESN